jgi:FkbM family methyltransferase
LGSNPKVEVIAIEPFGPNMQALKHNLACNPGFGERTTTHALAIGSQRGSFDLFFDPESPLTPSLLDKPGFVKANQVDVMPFSELTDLKLDAIKIDVEGAEVILMEGLLPYLQKHQPKIIIEILDEEKFKAIQELTASLGYVLTPIQEQKGASKNYQMIVNV